MKRTLTDFLGKELLFEHLRTIYRYYLGTGGYERAEMVENLASFLTSASGVQRVTEGMTEEEIALLYVLRQVGGIAPRRWLFRELALRNGHSTDSWKKVFWGLRRRHLTFLIGSDIAYLPDGIADVLGKRISGEPPAMKSDVVPGASAVRQSVHGLVISLLGYLHQNPPRVMAEEERIWKRDLEGMADFFHSYLYEAGANGGSLGLIRGRLSRLVELLRKMGFLEKRGKRLYVDVENWTDWTNRPEVERQSLFLSFLKDHYENIPIALESLVDWKQASWIPLDRLTEAVRLRSLRSTFHVLRVRPQGDVVAEGPGRRWVAACIHLLADLGLVFTGSDERGEPLARATDGAVEAWQMLHEGRSRRRAKRESGGPRAYAQPNFELLFPEECAASLHRQIAMIAEIRSLDRFWTYALTPNSVARGVEEGMTVDGVTATLEDAIEGTLPANVRDAVQRWAATAWWVEGDGQSPHLGAERSLFESIQEIEGAEEYIERANGQLRLLQSREASARWLEEHGIRVVAEERDPPGEFGRSTHDDYARAVEAWQRRVEHGGEGTPAGSYWDDVVPVEPLPEASR